MIDPMDRSIRETQVRVTELVYNYHDGVVQQGPFAGMKLLPHVTWASTTLAPMILGCFEQEITEYLESEIRKLEYVPNAKVANIGCAEGYYAVGLARRLPNATVWAVDIDEGSLDAARANADANNVHLTIGEDAGKIMNTADLIVMDVEGNEIHYLDPVVFPGLKKAAIFVEIHNLPVTDTRKEAQQTDNVLLDRFKETHHVMAIFEGARNPNNFAVLRRLNNNARWLAVSENRPVWMFWYVMLPKGVNDASTADTSGVATDEAAAQNHD